MLAHASATGRLLLWALADEEVDRHLEGCMPERAGPDTITDIRDRVRAVRSTGVSVTDEDLEAGVRTVAGLRFHVLRHSYATWLVDDGVPVNTVQRVLGHERSSTTRDLCTRRTDDPSRVLQALDEPEQDGERMDG